MTIKQFIEKAIEGGWRGFKSPDAVIEINYKEYKLKNDFPLSGIMLDPLAWQAVYKGEDGLWKSKMLGMINALINGKTIEQFLETL